MLPILEERVKHPTLAEPLEKGLYIFVVRGSDELFRLETGLVDETRGWSQNFNHHLEEGLGYDHIALSTRRIRHVSGQAQGLFDCSVILGGETFGLISY